MRSSAPVAVNLLQHGSALTSRLIAVNPAFEELVFDANGLEDVGGLDGSAGLTASAQMNTAWFRFTAENAVVVRGYPQPAFRARLPSVILRMQRRESMRYPVPAFNAPVCDFKHEAAAICLRVLDISLSGVSLAVEESNLKFAAGSVLRDCLLQLPKLGAIQTDLHVAYEKPGEIGIGRRIGCRFTNIRTTSLTHLQRYVSVLERERLASEAQSAMESGAEL